MYYNREGNKITLEEWSGLIAEDRGLASNTMPDGTMISTVFLGVDGFGKPPLIFETAVFKDGSYALCIETNRYCTEEEALAGHASIVEKYSIPKAE